MSDPSLVGVTAFFQAAVPDPGAIQGIALSNGVQVAIG